MGCVPRDIDERQIGAIFFQVLCILVLSRQFPQMMVMVAREIDDCSIERGFRVIEQQVDELGEHGGSHVRRHQCKL